jgi:hypothetical protein
MIRKGFRIFLNKAFAKNTISINEVYNSKIIITIDGEQVTKTVTKNEEDQ